MEFKIMKKIEISFEAPEDGDWYTSIVAWGGGIAKKHRHLIKNGIRPIIYKIKIGIEITKPRGEGGWYRNSSLVIHGYTDKDFWLMKQRMDNRTSKIAVFTYNRNFIL